jgi:hypothetical protein
MLHLTSTEVTRMTTSTVQAIKLAIVAATGLSKDALHIYVGLGVYLLAALALRKRLQSLAALLAVVLVACLGEVLDMRDDIHSLGYWRWSASLHDVVNTSFWPFVLFSLGRWTSFFRRHEYVAEQGIRPTGRTR